MDGQAPQKSAVWHASLFGQFTVSNARETHKRFESKRAIALLAYLIIHPDGQPREALADRLWPEADIVAARNRLKQTLAALRRLLEPPGEESGSVLVADRVTIGIQPGAISSDYGDFLAAFKAGDDARIQEIASREFLPGIYDEWLDDVRLWIESNSHNQNFVPQLNVHPATQIPVREQKQAQTIQIPRRVTNFYGRDGETTAVLEQLRVNRFVTITGIGGIGKTRLSLNVAEHADFANIAFVSLAEVDDPSQLLQTILNSLGFSKSGQQTPLETLAQLNRSESHLIILDNLEQLAGPETAKLLSALLEMCPSTKILASSRIPVGIDGETYFPLFPLPVPQENQTLAEVANLPTTRLFVDRARKSRADFQITERNFEPLKSLFQKLGGMPLAIELCAAWSHVLTPSQMIAKLESDDSLLVSKRKDVPDRQRSLLDAFATTTSLLTQEQLDLLIQLSVFRGGWSIELLNAVTGGQDSLDLVSELTRAALVIAETDNSELRFSMLESLRQFAESLPDERSLKASLQTNLFELFLDLSKKTFKSAPEPRFQIENEFGWSQFWNLEWDNLRASVTHALAAGRHDEVSHLMFNTEWYWRMYSRESEVVSWLHQVVENQNAPKEAKLRAEILIAYHTGTKGFGRLLELLPESESADDLLRVFHLYAASNQLAFYRKWDQIEIYASQAIPIAIRIGEYRLAGKSHHNIGIGYQLRGMSEESVFHFDQAERLIRKANRIHDLLSLLYDRAYRATSIGELETGIMLFKEVIDRQHQTGDQKLISRCYNLLGTTYHRSGKWTEGNAALAKSIEIYTGMQDLGGALYPLWNLGLYLPALGEFRIGVPLLAASIHIWENILGLELSPEEKVEVENMVTAADESIGKELRLALERKGRSMSLSELNEFVNTALQRGHLDFEESTVARVF